MNNGLLGTRYRFAHEIITGKKECRTYCLRSEMEMDPLNETKMWNAFLLFLLRIYTF